MLNHRFEAISQFTKFPRNNFTTTKSDVYRRFLLRHLRLRHLLASVLICLLLRFIWIVCNSESQKIKDLKIVYPLVKLLQDNPNLFILEPHLLSGLIDDQIAYQDLKWRFDLPPKFVSKRNCLTVGVFEDNLNELNLNQFTSVAQVKGHRTHRPNRVVLLHEFYQITHLDIILHLHLVILYQVKHYLWIGYVHNQTQLSNRNVWSSQYFGVYEQIFDSFSLSSIEQLHIPDDVPHLLSQLPTSRYIDCPSKRRRQWFEENDTDSKVRYEKEECSEKAIIAMKGLMRALRMQFWIASGTLLGWHRQCHIIPYTSDTDFATRSRYLENVGFGMGKVLATSATKWSLRLFQRFGSPDDSLEYSFRLELEQFHEKIDLFFVYQNDTHYLQTIHVPESAVYTHQAYPPYKLCSVVLLGHKLLAPCTAEQVVLAEYGPNWTEPISNWSYIRSPFNLGKWKVWTGEKAQHEYF